MGTHCLCIVCLDVRGRRVLMKMCYDGTSVSYLSVVPQVMSDPGQPFGKRRYELGVSHGGHPLVLNPMTSASANVLGVAAAAIDPWAHHGFSAAKMVAGFEGLAGCYQLECGGELAGGVVVVCPWLAGPYLQILVVTPEHQNKGIGTSMLAWFESEARGRFRNLWLCVSAFNLRARCFYGAHGFRPVATLGGLLCEGEDELLMRKNI